MIENKICRYKTKKTLQDKGLNSNLLHNSVPTSSATAAAAFTPARRIPVQMLVRDGKPCPTDFVSSYPSTGTLPNSFSTSSGYFPQAAATLPQNSQYYGWNW